MKIPPQVVFFRSHSFLAKFQNQIRTGRLARTGRFCTQFSTTGRSCQVQKKCGLNRRSQVEPDCVSRITGFVIYSAFKMVSICLVKANSSDGFAHPASLFLSWDLKRSQLLSTRGVQEICVPKDTSKLAPAFTLQSKRFGRTAYSPDGFMPVET